MGHSIQAMVLLAQAAGMRMAVPVSALIQEGLRWSNRDRCTLLDKLGVLLGLQWSEPFRIVTEAYYVAPNLLGSFWARVIK